jgi:hypothetical protein
MKKDVLLSKNYTPHSREKKWESIISSKCLKISSHPFQQEFFDLNSRDLSYVPPKHGAFDGDISNCRRE